MSAAHPLVSLILQRRSIRVYTDKPVSDASITTMLEAAMASPSACAKDPWRFIVIRDKSTLERAANGLPNGKMLAQANVGIVVCGDTEAAHDHQVGYLLQDCSAAIENLLLAAQALELGACWLGVHPRADRMNHLTNLLSIPSQCIPIACIAIGYPGEVKEARTRLKQEYVHREKW